MKKLNYRKVLAHRVIHRGMVFPLSIVEITDEGEVSVAPFTGECHSTAMINGTVAVLRDNATTATDYAEKGFAAAIFVL